MLAAALDAEELRQLRHGDRQRRAGLEAEQDGLADEVDQRAQPQQPRQHAHRGHDERGQRGDVRPARRVAAGHAGDGDADEHRDRRRGADRQLARGAEQRVERARRPGSSRCRTAAATRPATHRRATPGCRRRRGSRRRRHRPQPLRPVRGEPLRRREGRAPACDGPLAPGSLPRMWVDVARCLPMKVGAASRRAAEVLARVEPQAEVDEPARPEPRTGALFCWGSQAVGASCTLNPSWSCAASASVVAKARGGAYSKTGKSSSSCRKSTSRAGPSTGVATNWFGSPAPHSVNPISRPAMNWKVPSEVEMGRCSVQRPPPVALKTTSCAASFETRNITGPSTMRSNGRT